MTNEQERPTRVADLREARLNIDSGMTNEAILVSNVGGTFVGLVDPATKGEDKKLIGNDPLVTDAKTFTLAIHGSKQMTIDMANLEPGAVNEVQIESDKSRDPKKTVITNFTGQPRLRIDDGHVSVQMEAGEAFGFKAQPTQSGQMEVSSSVTLAKDDKGNILVQRNGQTIMTVEKDAKVDIRDKDGNVLFTVDGAAGLEKNQKALREAEEKAFEKYKAALKNRESASFDPDLADKTLFLRPMSDQPAQAQAQGQQPAQPQQQGGGMMDSLSRLGSGVQDTLRQVTAPLQQQLTATARDSLTAGLPRITGIGGGGRTGGS